MALPWITLLTILPAVGALATVLCNRQEQLARRLALAFSFVTLAGIIAMIFHFDGHSGALQFEERYAWVPALHIDYRVGVDGLSLAMLLLSGIERIVATTRHICVKLQQK